MYLAVPVDLDSHQPELHDDGLNLRLSRSVVIVDHHSETVVHHVTCQNVAAATGKVVVRLVEGHQVLIPHDVPVG